MADRIAKFASRDASNGIPAMVGYCESSICRSLHIISQYGSSCTSSAKLREECKNWSDWMGQSWTDLRPVKGNRSDEESGNEAPNRLVDDSAAHKIVAPSFNKILTSTICWGMKWNKLDILDKLGHHATYKWLRTMLLMRRLDLEQHFRATEAWVSLTRRMPRPRHEMLLFSRYFHLLTQTVVSFSLKHYPRCLATPCIIVLSTVHHCKHFALLRNDV